MDGAQVVSPSDPRTKPKTGAKVKSLLAITAVIGAGSWVYKDFSEHEIRELGDCISEIAAAPSGAYAFDRYGSVARGACPILSQDDANDIALVTVLNVCSHDPETKENIKHFFLRSLKNSAINFCREKGRRMPVPYIDYNILSEAPDETLEAAPEQIEAIRLARKRLSETDRKLIDWRFLDQRTYPDIAEMLGVKSWKTAKTRVESALDTLRKKYTDIISDR